MFLTDIKLPLQHLMTVVDYEKNDAKFCLIVLVFDLQEC